MARLHEYQGKTILAANGFKIPRGRAASTADEAVAAAKELAGGEKNGEVAIKIQAWTTGRAGIGGVACIHVRFLILVTQGEDERLASADVDAAVFIGPVQIELQPVAIPLLVEQDANLVSAYNLPAARKGPTPGFHLSSAVGKVTRRGPDVVIEGCPENRVVEELFEHFGACDGLPVLCPCR